MLNRLRPYLPAIRRWLPGIITVLLAAAAGSSIAVSLIVSTDNGNGGTRTITIPVIKPKPQTAPLGELQKPLGEANLRDEAGKATDPQGIEKSKRAGAELRPQAVGGAQTYHCAEHFNSSIYSSRNGIKPTEFVVHYTAGNGTAATIHNYFLRLRAASATYILEPNRRCIQEVPESMKPWTQLAANPYAISVEIVTTGYNVSRAQWLAMPIFRNGTLADLMRDAMRRHGIPLRRVDPVGCNFVPGWTDHNALECGNNHTDVTPSFPYDVLQRQLVQGHPSSLLTTYERKVIRGTARPKGTGHSRGYWCDRNRGRRHTLRRLGLGAHHRRERGRLLLKSYRKRCRV